MKKKVTLPSPKIADEVKTLRFVASWLRRPRGPRSPRGDQLFHLISNLRGWEGDLLFHLISLGDGTRLRAISETDEVKKKVTLPSPKIADEVKTLRFVASWLRGFVASWLRGFVASWLRGFVASWLRGFVASPSEGPEEPEGRSTFSPHQQSSGMGG